jgi:spore germination protein
MTQYLLPAPSSKVNFLQKIKQKIITSSAYNKIFQSFKKYQKKEIQYWIAAVADLALILIILFNGATPAQQLIAPLISSKLEPLETAKSNYEVFGFAPYWTFNNLDNVNFDVLTTFAYFGVEVDENGNLDKDSKGYEVFKSDKATNTFKKAHQHGTKVVLTVTQMDNANIRGLMDSPEAQENAINQIVAEVKGRGIDGVNIDMEYTGNPGQDYRDKFTVFTTNLTNRLHQEMPHSKVTVSVYASAVKEPKIYDIGQLGQVVDGVFMMAYDFAVAGSDNAIPTAPLYGHKEGKYWYDISTAVDDFLKRMPADKLILGVPYYGYNYLVYTPEVKAETRPYYSWRGTPKAQTYSIALENIKPDMPGIDNYTRGWDEYGKVGYVAYHIIETDTWRMLFIDDEKSLAEKYKFAKSKDLAGVGMWALGFDNGKQELWNLLASEFGTREYADRSLGEIK